MQKQGISRPLLLVSVLMVAVVLVLIYLQFGALNEKKAEAEAEALMLSQAQTKLASLRELAKRESEFNEYLAVFEQLMPAAAQDETLIVDMQSAADLSELQFKVIRFGERAENEGSNVLPMQMTFEGRFHGLLNLLEYIRVYERAVRIEEIRIVLSQEEPDITVNLKASAFYTGE